MTFFKIIPTIFSVFGCVANSFCLTYFILYERKGLTNRLFILLSMWDFWNSAVVTARVWTPLNATWVFMQPLYFWILNINHFVLILIAWTRMVKICAPFYHIKKKGVWMAMLAHFLYFSTVPVTLNVKGEFKVKQIFHLGGWQLGRFGSIQEARPWSADQFAFCQLTGPRTSLRFANWSADQFAKW